MRFGVRFVVGIGATRPRHLSDGSYDRRHGPDDYRERPHHYYHCGSLHLGPSGYHHDYRDDR